MLNKIQGILEHVLDHW